MQVLSAVTAAQPGRPDPEDRGGASCVERWFLRVMLGVSVVAWSALLLAELGWFRLGLVAFLLAVAEIGFVLWGAFRAVPPASAAAGGGLKPALVAAAGILLCAALFLPPYHTEMAAGDATVYLNFGRQIARPGALEFEDPLPRQLSLASRAELFRNRVPGDLEWRVRVSLDGPPYSRFPGGFLIPDIADPTVTAGFSPLFPVLTVLGHALVSPQGALVVAPLFATLSLIGLWCVARRLGGVRAAWLAVALTAVSMPQIWFAKDPLPETLAQCFVMAGVLAWLVATARGAPPVGVRRGMVPGPGLFRQGRSHRPPDRLPAGRRRGAAPRAREAGRPAPAPAPARGFRPPGGPQPRALPQFRLSLQAVHRVTDPDVGGARPAAGLRAAAGGGGPGGGAAGGRGSGRAPPAGGAVVPAAVGTGRGGRARRLRRRLRDGDHGTARRDDRLAELVLLLAGAGARGAGAHGAGSVSGAPPPRRGWSSPACSSASSACSICTIRSRPGCRSERCGGTCRSSSRSRCSSPP